MKTELNSLRESSVARNKTPMLLAKQLDKMMDEDQENWKLCKISVHCPHLRLVHQRHKQTRGGQSLRASAGWPDANKGLFQEMGHTSVLTQQRVG